MMVGRTSRWAYPVLVPVALLAFFVAAGSATASGFCALELAPDAAVLNAKITSTQPGAATALVTVSAEVPPFQSNSLVQFIGQVDTGWPLSIRPSTISFGSPGTYVSNVQFTVIVPPGEYVQNATVTLQGKLLADGVYCSEAATDGPIVRVLPYVQAPSLVASQSLYVPRGPHGTVQVPLSFLARANGDVELEINYTFPDEVMVEGTNRIPIRMERGEVSAEWEIQVASRDGRAGVFEVRVEVTVGAVDLNPAGTNTSIFLQVDEGLLNPTTAPIVLLAFAGFGGAAAWFFYVGFLRDRERNP